MSRFGRRKRLPRHLREIQASIEDHARGYGLDFYQVIFEVLNYEEMNQVAAYGGFPRRYPHWRFGMEFERLSKSYTYGLHKIYEMVINNDPCYAYLLEGNSLVDQKMVMAHVLAHCDFFKNNLFFSHTNRKMMNAMANHASYVTMYMNRFGRDPVESFLDSCLSLDNLVDPVRGPGMVQGSDDWDEEVEESWDEVSGQWQRQSIPSYLSSFLRRSQSEQDPASAPDGEVPTPLPGLPVDEYGQDLMGFLLHHAPLEAWEQTLLEIVRREAYYFVPQGQTKIMNEGWATYWHSKLMTERILTAADVVDYADHASGITATTGRQLNPYKLGVELLRHVEDRWNKGRFGKQWDECEDAQTRADWDTQAGLGREKLFEVRRCYNDVTFIDEFLTEEFCASQGLFTMEYSDHRQRWEVLSRGTAKVRHALLGQLTNLGNPVIRVIDANHGNQGELLLWHDYYGTDLRIDWARDVLGHLHRLWKRPVRLVTQMKEKLVHLRFDGRDHAILEMGEPEGESAADEE